VAQSSQKTVQAGDTTALLLGAKLQIHVILRPYLDVAVDSDFKLIVQDSLVSKSPQLLTPTLESLKYSGLGFLQHNSSFQDDEIRCQLPFLCFPSPIGCAWIFFPPRRKSRKTAKHSCSGAIAATR
jgi:hypothetical protein